MLTTHDIVDRLGGVVAAARALGVTHPNVVRWKSAGAFPPTHLLTIARLVDVDPSEIPTTPSRSRNRDDAA